MIDFDRFQRENPTGSAHTKMVPHRSPMAGPPEEQRGTPLGLNLQAAFSCRKECTPHAYTVTAALAAVVLLFSSFLSEIPPERYPRVPVVYVFETETETGDGHNVVQILHAGGRG